MLSDEKKFNQELSKDVVGVIRIEVRKRLSTKEVDLLGQGKVNKKVIMQLCLSQGWVIVGFRDEFCWGIGYRGRILLNKLIC